VELLAVSALGFCTEDNRCIIRHPSDLSLLKRHSRSLEAFVTTHRFMSLQYNRFPFTLPPPPTPQLNIKFESPEILSTFWHEMTRDWAELKTNGRPRVAAEQWRWSWQKEDNLIHWQHPFWSDRSASRFGYLSSVCFLHDTVLTYRVSSQSETNYPGQQIIVIINKNILRSYWSANVL
jgi:hypothetical protein